MGSSNCLLYRKNHPEGLSEMGIFGNFFLFSKVSHYQCTLYQYTHDHILHTVLTFVSTVFSFVNTVLEFFNNLWGQGTKLE